jgi:hypothetical protein
MAPVLPMLMGGLMMAMNKPPKPPAPQPPARMPDPNSPEVIAARKRRLEDQASTKGRASTNLTGNQPTAAPTFTNETLGS